MEKQNHMNAQIWTANMKITTTGSIMAVTIDSFEYIMAGGGRSAAENRMLALKLMQQAHERLVAEDFRHGVQSHHAYRRPLCAMN